MYVENITNIYPDILPVGTICKLIDRNSSEYFEICTIRFIEMDEEGYWYYYLLANDFDKNVLYDPRFGRYFSFIEINSPFLIPLSSATLQ